MKVIIFCAVLCYLAAVNAAENFLIRNQQQCTGYNCPDTTPLVINYNARRQISASVQLDCGHQGNNFRLTVTPNDQHERMARPNAAQLNGLTTLFSTDDDGSGALVLEGPLNELALEAGAEGDCETDGSVNGGCFARYRGLLRIRQHIRVPHSVTPLFWFGYADVSVVCLAVPRQSPILELPAEHTLSSTLGACRPFTHHLTISPLTNRENTVRVTVSAELTTGSFQENWQLHSCVLTPLGGYSDSPNHIIENGQAAPNRRVDVTVVRHVHPTRYDVDLTFIDWPHASSRLDCTMKMCAMSSTSLMERCPNAGPMTSRPVARTLGASWGIDGWKTGTQVPAVLQGRMDLINPANPNQFCESS